MPCLVHSCDQNLIPYRLTERLGQFSLRSLPVVVSLVARPEGRHSIVDSFVVVSDDGGDLVGVSAAIATTDRSHTASTRTNDMRWLCRQQKVSQLTMYRAINLCM